MMDRDSGEEPRRRRPVSRRRFLSVVGVATAAGLAGCSGESDGDDPTSTSPDETPSPTRETASPTDRVQDTESPTDGGASIRTGDDWRTFQNDSGRTGHDPDATPPTGPVSVQWRTELPEGRGNSTMTGQPVLAEDTLFTASVHDSGESLKLYAVDAGTGDLVWENTVPSLEGAEADIFAAPTYAEGTVYFYTAASQLVAARADDGAIEWTTPVAPTFRNQATSPVFADGTLYVTPGEPTDNDASSGVAAVDPATGDVGWRYSDYPASFADSDTDDSVKNDGDASHFEALALGDGSLYAADEGLYSIAPGADTETWEIPSSQDDPRLRRVGGWTLGYADGVVYNKGFGWFSAVTPSGDLRWSYEDGHRPNQSGFVAQVGCAVANGAVFYTTAAGTEPNLFAVDIESGAERWTAAAANERRRFQNSPVVGGAGEQVIVSDSAQTLVAFDTASGERVWDLVTEGRAAGVEPIVANGAVYFSYFDYDAGKPVLVAAA